MTTGDMTTGDMTTGDMTTETGPVTTSEPRPLRIGMVCPYSWDVPGGVQAHVRDLAEALIAMGHHVSVLAPGEEDAPGLADYVVAAGKAVPIPYNGSVARVQFGLVSAARVRRWLRDGDFDVVHVHEPAPPSLSLLTLILHNGPIVATFHAAANRSRILGMSDTVLQPFLEKLAGRIAVSPAARKMIVEHLGGRRGRHPERGRRRSFRRRRPTGRLSPRGWHRGLHRPLRRAPQRDGRARRGPGSARTRSAGPAAGPGRARRRRTVPLATATHAGRPGRPARPGQRDRQGPPTAQR